MLLQVIVSTAEVIKRKDYEMLLTVLPPTIVILNSIRTVVNTIFRFLRTSLLQTVFRFISRLISTVFYF
jgi:hypothetical protein